MLIIQVGEFGSQVRRYIPDVHGLSGDRAEVILQIRVAAPA
jgi:hypothetical protein